MRRRLLAGLALAGAALALGPAAAVARAALPGSTVRAREAFFGAANVDRTGRVRADRVILSWFGVASLAASFRGRVVLLDSYVNTLGPAECGSGRRAPRDRGYVPTDYDALAHLRPEAIFVGHEHFDHQCRTGELVARTGAQVVGLPQACAAAAEDLVAYRRRPRALRCPATLGSFSPFGAVAEIRPLGRETPVTAVRNLHSGAASSPIVNAAGAESVLYRFRLGRFSLVWNDTVGPVREKSPRLRGVLAALPATDVQFGSTLSSGIAEQGLRDPVDYMQALRTRRFYAIHQDFSFPDPPSGGSRALRPRLAAEMRRRRGLRTELRWLQDPRDYVRPIVLDPGARRWR